MVASLNSFLGHCSDFSVERGNGLGAQRLSELIDCSEIRLVDVVRYLLPVVQKTAARSRPVKEVSDSGIEEGRLTSPYWPPNPNDIRSKKRDKAHVATKLDKLVDDLIKFIQMLCIQNSHVFIAILKSCHKQQNTLLHGTKLQLTIANSTTSTTSSSLSVGETILSLKFMIGKFMTGDGSSIHILGT